MIKDKYLSQPHKGHNITIQVHYTCQLTFVIYIIKCRCGLLYFGETTQKVKACIDQHKYTIRDELTQLPLARHCRKKTFSVST